MKIKSTVVAQQMPGGLDRAFGDKTSERFGLVVVRGDQGLEIFDASFDRDDGQRIASLKQHGVHHQSGRASVAVGEGVNGHEVVVQFRGEPVQRSSASVRRSDAAREE
jgi:hypothetical protein